MYISHLAAPTRLAALFAACCLTTLVKAQTTAPSTFATSIMVQGELEGTEFDDWAGVPVAFSDPADNPGDLGGRPHMDFKDLQVANDNDFLYLRMTYHNSSSVNTFLGIDIDQDSSTGFDLFGLGLVGSEVGYQNDFPFQQFNDVFNLNVALTGGPLTNGGALIYPFFDQDGADREWAIPLDLMLGFGVGDPASTVGFPNESIDLFFYTEEGAGDIIDVISYTFATAPVVDGDYNSDGVVDAADYTVWRDSEGDIGEGLPADGDGDLDVDDDDRIVWANNYGAPGSVASVAVPEPVAAALVLLAVTFTASCHRPN